MDARDAHRTFVRPKALIPNERARFQLDSASPWALLRRLWPGSRRLRNDGRDAGRWREDAGVPVLPADADARRIFVEHLLDHSCTARLRGSFGLDDDPVSDVNAHLRLSPSIFGVPFVSWSDGEQPRTDRHTARLPTNRARQKTEARVGIIAFLILGLLAGIIAKALLPGEDPGGVIVTMLIGVAGALVGGFLAGALFDAHPLDDFFDVSTWLTAIIGSIVLLVVYRLIVSGRHGGRRRVLQ